MNDDTIAQHEPDDYEITDAMIRYGGGFVSGLGSLYQQGDAVNRATLRVAFADFFANYRDIAIQRRGVKSAVTS